MGNTAIIMNDVDEKTKVIIYGAGKIGSIAAQFLSSRYDIIGFVDRDKTKVGTKVCGFTVFSRDYLRDNKELVVIAVSIDVDQIVQFLHDEYDIKKVMEFRIECNPKYLIWNDDFIDAQTIIRFKSGLGNQMFQYALLRYLKDKGNKCFADITSYYDHSLREFSLCDVFPNIDLNLFDSRNKERYISDSLSGNDRCYYIEPSYSFADPYYDIGFIDSMNYGYLDGYFQTYYYANSIRNQLLEDFTFSNSNDERLSELVDNIRYKNSVSIHVRRGDYLEKGNIEIFGGVCTREFYKKAISLIYERIEKPLFVFLSNDISWVRDNIKCDDALYINEDMFTDYRDWYDMYIMSICKHNIIANSSYSWWGAWLNRNTNKTVVAPKGWHNGGKWEHICPPEWIRL